MSRLPAVQSLEYSAPARRAVLMVNPFAGSVRRAAVARIVERLGLEDAAILEVGRDGSARDIAARVAKDGVPLMPPSA